jgi:hypothetical protein
VLLSEYSASFDTKYFLREELILGDETILPNAAEQKMKMPNSALMTNLPVLAEQNCRTWRNKQNCWPTKLTDLVK